VSPRPDPKLPLLPLSCALAAGVLLGILLAAGRPLLGLAGALLAPAALVALLLRRPIHLALPWLLLGLGLGMLRQALDEPACAPEGALSARLAEGTSREWRGTGVLAAGARRTRSGHQAVLALGPPLHPAAHDDGLRGRVRLWWRDGPDDLPAGTCVLVTGRLSRAGPPAHPFALDRRRAEAQLGVHATLLASAIVPIDDCDPDAPLRLAGALDRTRQRLEAAVEGSASPRAAAWILAVGAGTRGGMSDADRDEMSRLGLAHLLAVSGLHLSLFTLLAAGALERLLRLAPSLYLLRERTAWRAAIALPLAWAFALFTGAGPAAVRAALFVTAYSAATLLRRPRSAPAAIGAALTAILLHRPALLWSASLQLSVAAVLLLVAFARLAERRAALVTTRRPRRLGAFARAAFWSSLGAFVGSAPVLAHHFGAVSLTGLPANVLLAPILALVLVPASLLALLLAPHSPTAVVWLGASVESVVDATYILLDPLAALLGDPWIVGRPAPLEHALWCFASLTFLAGLERTARRRAGWTLAVLCVVSLLILGEQRRAPPRDLDVWFLPVGQGDATLLRTPSGHSLLVDAGGSPGASDPGREVVVPVLRAIGIRRLDVVVLTHADIDHSGGLEAVLAAFPARELWVNPRTAQHPVVARARESARGDPVIRWVLATDPPRALGGTRLEVLHPPEEAPSLDENDASVALRVTYAGRAVLFTGDSEAAGEALLVARERDRLRADVLQAPHHGSRTSSTPALLAAVLPSHVVVSAGEDNRFGFPHTDVMARYADYRALALRTDIQGLIRMRLGLKGIAVQTHRPDPH
jgi:competence protein ComEC